jgi:hypothetical protein
MSKHANLMMMRKPGIRRIGKHHTASLYSFMNIRSCALQAEDDEDEVAGLNTWFASRRAVPICIILSLARSHTCYKISGLAQRSMRRQSLLASVSV